MKIFCLIYDDDMVYMHFFPRLEVVNRRGPGPVNRTGSTGNRKTGWIQNPNKNTQFKRFLPVYRSGSTGNRSLNKKIELLEN
jgi:hypothetical protein